MILLKIIEENKKKEFYSLNNSPNDNDFFQNYKRK